MTADVTAVPTDQVRRAGAVDVPDLADVLAAAFDDDPVLTWIVPNRTRRRVFSRALFQVVLEAAVPHREVYAAGADPTAAAVWLPPGAGVEAAQGELVAAAGAVAEEAAERLLTVFQMITEAHPTQSHAYLFFLGTRPAHQSRGLGSMLLRHVLDRCDANGTPAYLEATSERNRDLYLRHGFVQDGVIQLPGGPPLLPMWREPRPVPDQT